LRLVAISVWVGLVMVTGGNDVLEMPVVRKDQQYQPAHEMSLLRTWNVREGRLDGKLNFWRIDAADGLSNLCPSLVAEYTPTIFDRLLDALPFLRWNQDCPYRVVVLDATATPVVPVVSELVSAPEPVQPDQGVYVTFYSCPPYCGDPSGPLPLGEGQAACDWAYMGRRFLLNGQEWICNDTGGLVHGNHVDLFFWDANNGWAYLAQYGTRGVLTWR